MKSTVKLNSNQVRDILAENGISSIDDLVEYAEKLSSSETPGHTISKGQGPRELGTFIRIVSLA